MHIKYLCTVHTAPITVDRCVQITDSGSIRANEWLVRSTDKNQSYSIIRQEASCFVSLNAPIDYCFLSRQVIPWGAFEDSLLKFYVLFYFCLSFETIRIKCAHSNRESERISMCNISYYLYSTDYCGKFLKKFQSFTFYVQQF